jgi:hypothetical protein
MRRCLAKWVVPCLALLFRLLGGVYRAVAWQWTPGSDSTIADFGREVTIHTDTSIRWRFTLFLWSINLKFFKVCRPTNFWEERNNLAFLKTEKQYVPPKCWQVPAVTAHNMSLRLQQMEAKLVTTYHATWSHNREDNNIILILKTIKEISFFEKLKVYNRIWCRNPEDLI